MAGNDLELAHNSSEVDVRGLVAALEQAHSVVEIRVIFDQAQAFVDVAKRARLADDQVRAAAVISLRAQRRGGELLKITPRAEGRPSADKPSLSTLLGLPREQARHLAEDWMKVAEIEEYVFENYLAQRDKIPTFKGLLRFRGPGPKRPAHRPRKDGSTSPAPTSEPRKRLSLVPQKESEPPASAVHPSILAAQHEAWNACVAWFAARHPSMPEQMLAAAEAANPYDHPHTREGRPS